MLKMSDKIIPFGLIIQEPSVHVTKKLRTRVDTTRVHPENKIYLHSLDAEQLYMLSTRDL